VVKTPAADESDTGVELQSSPVEVNSVPSHNQVNEADGSVQQVNEPHHSGGNLSDLGLMNLLTWHKLITCRGRKHFWIGRATSIIIAQ
jgi:hypothetical protein